MRRHVALWRELHGERSPRFRHATRPGNRPGEKQMREKFVRVAESSVASGLRDAESAILQAFAVFARAALDLDDAHLKLLVQGFPYLAKSLAEQARRFDPALSATDIFQASRNVWTAAGLQVLLGQRLELTPSIFAYSMLYPYTDNLLDDPRTSAEAKSAFNQRFRARLQGESPQPADHRECKVWALVEHDRKPVRPCPASGGLSEPAGDPERAGGKRRPAVRSRAAARRSDPWRSLQKEARPCSPTDIWRRAADPPAGGLRVRLGVLLQLADDLQDVAEDWRQAPPTLFSGTCLSRSTW